MFFITLKTIFWLYKQKKTISEQEDHMAAC